ncbi:hypothetical protein BYT27DRAFT_7203101 [Phlegmacium glaucopus]|nr:hypothetical protein BYT27DRAFT_7203101 [Phlegmacium glaucopus]
MVVSASSSDTPEMAADVDAADAGVDGGGAGGDRDGMAGGFEPPVLAPPAKRY